jgi:hypothetical protein
MIFAMAKSTPPGGFIRRRVSPRDQLLSVPASLAGHLIPNTLGANHKALGEASPSFFSVRHEA